jgi:hypothetical protein
MRDFTRFFRVGVLVLCPDISKEWGLFKTNYSL